MVLQKATAAGLQLINQMITLAELKEASIMVQYGKVWELMPYSSRGKPVKLNSCIIPSTEGMET